MRVVRKIFKNFHCSKHNNDPGLFLQLFLVLSKIKFDKGINLCCEDQNECVYGGRTHQKLPQLPKPCFFPAMRLWFEISNEQVKSQFETNLVERRIGKCHRGANTCNSSNAEYGCFCNHCTELIYIEVF